jgi:hypothetical protein
MAVKLITTINNIRLLESRDNSELIYQFYLYLGANTLIGFCPIVPIMLIQ